MPVHQPPSLHCTACCDLSEFFRKKPTHFPPTSPDVGKRSSFLQHCQKKPSCHGKRVAIDWRKIARSTPSTWRRHRDDTPPKTNMSMENPPFEDVSISYCRWWFSNVMLVFRCVFTRKHLRKETMAKHGYHVISQLEFFLCSFIWRLILGINWKRKVSQPKRLTPKCLPKRCFRANHSPSAMDDLRHHQGSKSLFERQHRWVGGKLSFRAKDHQGPNVFFQLPSGKR